MSVRIDDKLPRHPKILRVSAEAAWFFVCGLCYCREHSPDGTIPDSAIEFLGKHRRPKALAKELVGVALWENTSDGYRVHDYFDWNPSVEQVQAKRQKTVERQRRYRDGLYPRNGVTDASRNAVTNASVTPDRNGVTGDSYSVPFRSVPPNGDPPPEVSAPTEPPTPVEITGPFLQRFAEVYVESVRKCTDHVIGLNGLMRGDLAAIARSVMPRTSVEDAFVWLESGVLAFVRACGNDPRNHAGYAPRRFLEWLNAKSPELFGFQKPAAPPPEKVHATAAYQPFKGHQ